MSALLNISGFRKTLRIITQTSKLQPMCIFPNPTRNLGHTSLSFKINMRMNIQTHTTTEGDPRSLVQKALILALLAMSSWESLTRKLHRGCQ